ncbi:MAG TPA: hypothetical protein VK171_06760 [Fimbriimonas sp.]|nr:hypothetical protein [Fimbriimonas sp.]
MGITLGILIGLLVGLGAMLAKLRWGDRLLVFAKILGVIALLLVGQAAFMLRKSDAVVAATWFIFGGLGLLVLYIASRVVGTIFQKLDPTENRRHGYLLWFDIFTLLIVINLTKYWIFDPMRRDDVTRHLAGNTAAQARVEQQKLEIPVPYRYMSHKMIVDMKADKAMREKAGLPMIPVPEGLFEKAEKLEKLKREVPSKGDAFLVAAREDKARQQGFVPMLIASWLVASLGVLAWRRKVGSGDVAA